MSDVDETQTRDDRAAGLLVQFSPSLYPRTDLGNANYFATLWADALRFDHAHKRWLRWEDHR
jgi:hypothetical protein